MNIYFDANYSRYVAEAFNLLEMAYGENAVFSTVNEIGDNAPDEDVVLHVAKNRGILFTKDKDFKKAKLIVELMQNNPIGLFYYKTPKKEKHWDTISLLMRVYKNCRDIFSTKRIPYYYEIRAGGKLQKMDL